jgi:O-antigen ligase
MPGAYLTNRISKAIVLGAILVMAPLLMFFAYRRPGYFANQTYLEGLLFLEGLVLSIWLYRRVFFGIVVMAFLLSGINLPVGTVWASGRWLFLLVGAFVGFILVVKDHAYAFTSFHLAAGFAVLAAVVSTADSDHPSAALLKVLSLFLLFVYAATNARIAVAGRESRFFSGLLLACEVLVGANALFYAIGIEAMGNPNSLGAVMGVVGMPVLLWGALLAEERMVTNRRWFLFAVSVYLTFHSHARAGLLAGLVSCMLLCIALQRYKLLIEGTAFIVAVLATSMIATPDAMVAAYSATIYKTGSEQQGLLASREAPWQRAETNIREHPWFGMGLGTTVSGGEGEEQQLQFSSSSTQTTENGSSYLAIASGVGLFGSLPVLWLLLTLAKRISQTIRWMRSTGSPLHPAVPVSLVLVAAVIHAGFEDWMFAPGNYMCVFFWCLAFILVDVTAPNFRSSQTSGVTGLSARQLA